MLIGGAGSDFIDGQQGNDTILMGDGDDTFQWDPGDGSDTVDGGAGVRHDACSTAPTSARSSTSSANGDHARFTRNIASIVMDLDNLEKVRLNALGGADTVTVGDMSGTDVKQVDIDLAASGTLTPDGADRCGDASAARTPTTRSSCSTRSTRSPAARCRSPGFPARSTSRAPTRPTR